MSEDDDNKLKEENLFEHVQAVAVKRVIVYQIAEEMKRNKLTKAKFFIEYP